MFISTNFRSYLIVFNCVSHSIASRCVSLFCIFSVLVFIICVNVLCFVLNQCHVAAFYCFVLCVFFGMFNFLLLSPLTLFLFFNLDTCVYEASRLAFYSRVIRNFFLFFFGSMYDSFCSWLKNHRFMSSVSVMMIILRC